MLALTSAMWILPALLGPSYASLTSSLASWRWALGLLVVPMLLVRFYVARQLRELPETERDDSPLQLGSSVALAASVALVLVASKPTPFRIVVAILGVVGALIFARRLMPPGVFSLSRGRAAGIGLLMLLCFVYCGGDDILPLFVTYGLHGSVPTAGFALTLGALAWAIAGILQERAKTPLIIAGRLRFAAVLLFVGFAGLAVLLASFRSPDVAWLSALFWCLVGLGMGVAYPSLLTFVFDDGQEDGLRTQVATGVVLAEALAGGLGGTVSGAVFSAWTSSPRGCPEVGGTSVAAR